MKALDELEHKALMQARRGAAAVCHYQGLGGCASACDLVVVTAPDGAVVLFSERDDNPGTSITHCFDQLASDIYQQQLQHYAPDSIRWLERYPAHAGSQRETLDRAKLHWNGGAFQIPAWEYVDLKAEAYG